MKWLIYGITILIVIGLRIIYQNGDLEGLLFILEPVAFIVEKFLGVDFKYIEGIGFINKNLKTNITRECSGVNFFTISFLMLIFSFINKIRNNRKKAFTAFSFLIISYIITVFANTSRIIGTISMMQMDLFSNIKIERLAHQTIGVIVYFIYLVLIYFIGLRLSKEMGDQNE